MAINIGELRAVLSLKDEMSARIGEIKGHLDAMTSAVNFLGRAIGGAFSVEAVLSFVRDTMAAADTLKRLSDQTGISVQGLQQLQDVGDDAGVSLEGMANAVSQLQRRLAGGNESALAAMEDLGLSWDHLKTAGPQVLFFEIAEAIKGIKDPADQANAAFQLMGRTGVQMLPVLKADIEAIRNSTVHMSDESIEAWDKLGDATTRWGRTTKTILAETIIGMGNLFSQLGHLGAGTAGAWGAAEKAKEAKDLADSIEGARKKAEAMLVVGNPFKAVKVPSETDQKMFIAQQELARDAMNRAAEAAKKQAKAHEELREKLSTLENVLPGLRTQLGALDETELRATERWLKMTAAIAEFEHHAYSAEFGAKGLAEGLTSLGERAESVSAELLAHLKALADMEAGYNLVGPTLEQARGSFQSFGKFLRDDFAKVILGAIQGGGNVLASIGSALGAKLFDIGGGLGKKMSEGLTKVLGSTIGGALNTILPGLGSILGAGLEKLWGWLTKSAQKEANRLRDTFVDAAGGIDHLNKRAHDAGLSLDRLLRARNKAELQQAIEEINQAIRFQDDAMRTLTETAKKYGFTIEELGPAMRRQELDKMAQDLYRDWQVLVAGEIDLNTITRRMSDSLVEYLNLAKRTGQEVPESMRAIIQRLIDLGLWTDEDGNKIASLEQSGLKFSMTVSEGLAAVVKEVKKLTDAIRLGLGLALEDLPRDVDINIHTNAADIQRDLDELRRRGGDWDWQPPEPPSVGASGGIVTASGIQRFARGGAVGSDTVPAMLTPGEVVLTQAQQTHLLRGQAGDIYVTIEVAGYLDSTSARRQLATLVKDELSQDILARRRLSAR